jgi:hypothetical protein
MGLSLRQLAGNVSPYREQDAYKQAGQWRYLLRGWSAVLMWF